MQLNKLGPAGAAALLASLLLAGSATSYGQVVLDPSNGHYYEVISAPGITWMNAETAALGLHYTDSQGNVLQGHLATITSASEDLYVGQAVANAGPAEFWLGGYQNPSTETSPTLGWTWVNAEGTFPGVNGTAGFDNAYANWNLGEPNDAYGPGTEQYLGINLGHVGAFNDEGNLGLIGGYVIEYDPNTVPDGGLVGVPDAATTIGLFGMSLTCLAALGRKLRK